MASNETQTGAIIAQISKAAVEQYELIRSSGATNMFDRVRVLKLARTIKCNDLTYVAADRSLYCQLLQNYGGLMKHYNISREE